MLLNGLYCQHSAGHNVPKEVRNEGQEMINKAKFGYMKSTSGKK